MSKFILCYRFILFYSWKVFFFFSKSNFLTFFFYINYFALEKKVHAKLKVFRIMSIEFKIKLFYKESRRFSTFSRKIWLSNDVPKKNWLNEVNSFIVNENINKHSISLVLFGLLSLYVCWCYISWRQCYEQLNY